MRLLPAAALVVAIGLAACGSGGRGADDEAKAKSAVSQFFTALERRDAARLCDKLLTKDFIQQTTGATGDRAGKECRAQFRQLRTQGVRLVRVEKVRVRGDKARAVATIRTQGQTLPRVLSLKKEDGDWRLAGGGAQ